jgi:RNA polymerase sigma factor (sigma-70 family)
VDSAFREGDAMATGQLRAVVSHLRRLTAGAGTGCRLTDAQLLDDFVARRDEASFEVLVWRHGTMVLNLGLRVLRDADEAEDVFQATFLIFARKAGSIGKGESVGSWLYKVAYRVALRARARSAKRRAREEPADEWPARDSADEVLWRDLRPVLDEEIDRLPEKYRAPFVLCYLQGHTNEEAAEQLGCPKGTVLSRLARGRERLRARLVRRGLALAAAGVVTALSEKAASASVPAALVSSTVNAALPFAAGTAAAGLVSAPVAALTEGVLHTMFLTKVKTAAAALLALAVLGTGASVVSHQTRAAGPGRTPAADSFLAAERGQDRERQERAAPADTERRRDARPAPAFQGKVTAISDDGKTLTLEGGGRGREVTKMTVKLADSTRVEFDGALKDVAKKLRVGDAVAVSLQEGSTDTAAVVQARRDPDVAGKVTALSADGKGLTLQPLDRTRREEPAPVEIKLTDATRTELVGALKVLGGKLKAGDAVAAWLQDGSKETAVALQAQRGPDVVGKITAVAADGKGLTLKVPPRNRGDEPATLEIKLTDATAVVTPRGERVGAPPTERTKPQVDYLGSVWLQEGSKDMAAVLQVERPRPDVVGTLSAMSDDGKVLTLESKSRSGEVSKTVIRLTDATKLEFVGGEPRDRKLRVGHPLMVWLQEGSTDTAAVVEANVQRRNPDVAGTIAAVSADGLLLTLEVRKRGEEQATRTEVRLTDKTEVDFAGTDKAEEKKLAVGYAAAVWLEEGSKDTAAVVLVAKPVERGR